MNKDFYTQLSNRYIFSLYDSCKTKRSGNFKKHMHTETEFGLITSGSGEYIIGGKSYIANEGDLLIMRSNEQHCIPSIHSETQTAFNIKLSNYFLWSICSDYISPGKIQALISPEAPFCHKIHSEKITSSIMNIKSLFDKYTPENAFALRAAVLCAVIDITCELCDVKCEILPSTERLNDIQRAIQYIEQNFSKQISLESMAKAAAMSVSYFSGSFKSITGTSPYNYLMITRIEHALNCIKTTEKTVMSIAFESGFTSITSFNKAFKKLIGVSPTEIRK